jgi:hypothetical protein
MSRRRLRCLVIVAGLAAIAAVWVAERAALSPHPPSAWATEEGGDGTPSPTDPQSDPPPEVAAEPEQPNEGGQPYETVALRGRVVWLAEALQRLFDISSDADVAESLVALETPEGRLFLIIKDARGRAFMKDPRLLDMDLELLVRVYEGSPMVQVVRIYTLKEDGKYELDYWCDVCAISMYELKSCECCQGPTRIRERRVEEEGKRNDP